MDITFDCVDFLSFWSHVWQDFEEIFSSLETSVCLQLKLLNQCTLMFVMINPLIKLSCLTESQCLVSELILNIVCFDTSKKQTQARQCEQMKTTLRKYFLVVL